ERVNHDVADTEDLLWRDSLALKVDVSVFRGRIQHIRQLIGDQAVDFLRHAAVERTKPRFDVADADSELCADQSGRNRRIDIAIDEYDIGLAFQHHGLEARHDFGRLPGM